MQLSLPHRRRAWIRPDYVLNPRHGASHFKYAPYSITFAKPVARGVNSYIYFLDPNTGHIEFAIDTRLAVIGAFSFQFQAPLASFDTPYDIFVPSGVLVYKGAPWPGILAGNWSIQIDPWREIVILGRSPAHMSTVTNLQGECSLALDRDVIAGSGAARLYREGEVAPVHTLLGSQLLYSGSYVNWHWPQALSWGVTYEIEIDETAFLDATDPSFGWKRDGVPRGAWRFETLGVGANPTVLSLSPPHGATGLTSLSEIEVTLSEPCTGETVVDVTRDGLFIGYGVLFFTESATATVGLDLPKVWDVATHSLVVYNPHVYSTITGRRWPGIGSGQWTVQTAAAVFDVLSYGPLEGFSNTGFVEFDRQVDFDFTVRLFDGETKISEYFHSAKEAGSASRVDWAWPQHAFEEKIYRVDLGFVAWDWNLYW